MTGYVKMERDRFKHDLFAGDKFCKGYAWDWMVARACWRATTYNVRGKTVAVERGQFFASPDEMAKAWGWSRSAVIRFLVRLKTEHMIGQEAGHNKTLITICNYEKYQATDDAPGHLRGRNIGQKSDTNRTPKEEDKERKKKEEKKESARDALAGVVGGELADAFVEHRRALRSPMTPHAGKLLAGKLATMDDPTRAIETAIERGWKSAFAEKTNVTPIRGKQDAGPSFDDYFDAFVDRLAVQRLE